jgi:signal peptidase I
MTYENFLKIILKQEVLDEQIKEAYKLKIDLIEFVDRYNEIISILITEIYGEDGYEWYSWFCYENDYGRKDWSSKDGKIQYIATDKSGNPICYSFETLWEYLEENHLIINKEKTDVMKETQEEFISLYDYVGHKDEKGIGKNLYNFAINCGVKPGKRQISNPKYTGIVRTYPRLVINTFFKLSSLNK